MALMRKSKFNHDGTTRVQNKRTNTHNVASDSQNLASACVPRKTNTCYYKMVAREGPCCQEMLPSSLTLTS
eukprot:5884495-Amphidinium_carterae.1